MSTLELNKLIEKTFQTIANAMMECLDGVPTTKYKQLGDSVKAALEELKQEVESKPIHSDSVSNAITFNHKQYVLGEDGTCVYVTCDGERVWQDPPKRKTK